MVQKMKGGRRYETGGENVTRAGTQWALAINIDFCGRCQVKIQGARVLLLLAYSTSRQPLRSHTGLPRLRHGRTATAYMSARARPGKNLVLYAWLPVLSSFPPGERALPSV